MVSVTVAFGEYFSCWFGVFVCLFVFAAAFADILKCQWWLKPNPCSQMRLTLSSRTKLCCYDDLKAGWKAQLLHCICPGEEVGGREVSCCPPRRWRDALAVLASHLKGCAGAVRASTAPCMLPGLPG